MGPMSKGAVGGVTGLLLAVYLLLLPVQIKIVTGFRFAPSDLFLAAALVVYTAAGRLEVRRGTISVWHLLLVVVFLASILVSAVRELDVTRYVLLNKGVGLLVLACLYLFVTSVVRDWSQLRWVLRVFLLGLAFHAVVGMAALAAFYTARLRFPLVNAYPMRLSGMLFDPNAFGGLLVLGLTILLAANVRPAPLLRGWTGRLTTLILALGIALSFSRSAWVALAVMATAVSVYDWRVAVRAALLGALCIVAVLLVSGGDQLGVLIELATRPSTIEDRLEYITTGMEEFSRHPVFGVGMGFFSRHHGFIIHNTLLWILTEMGIVGLVVFMGFMAWFLWIGVRTMKSAPPAQRSLVLGLVLAFLAMAGLSLGIEALYQRHWWLVMALLASAHAITLEEGVKKKAEEGGRESPGNVGTRPAWAGGG